MELKTQGALLSIDLIKKRMWQYSCVCFLSFQILLIRQHTVWQTTVILFFNLCLFLFLSFSTYLCFSHILLLIYGTNAAFTWRGRCRRPQLKNKTAKYINTCDSKSLTQVGNLYHVCKQERWKKKTPEELKNNLKKSSLPLRLQRLCGFNSFYLFVWRHVEGRVWPEVWTSWSCLWETPLLSRTKQKLEIFFK